MTELITNQSRGRVTLTWRKNIPTPVPVPMEHQHLRGFPFPVVCCDFNGTLTSSTEYPIDAGPFPRVKTWLDKWVSMGACIHVASSSLDFGTNDIPVFLARQKQLMVWAAKYNLPIGYASGKVRADIFYDDRMVPVGADGDWDKIGPQTEKTLSKRFDVKGGKFQRNDLPDYGATIVDYPTTSEVPPDRPRGFTGPKLDVDFHGTLTVAGDSTRISAAAPGAIRAINRLYNAGVTIHLSCAGWSPLSHDPGDSKERYNGLRKWAQDQGVLYDRIVTKDGAECFIDNQGVRFDNWKDDLPLLVGALKASDLGPKTNAPWRGL